MWFKHDRLSGLYSRIKSRDVAAISILSIVYLTSVSWAWPTTLDDSFITLRYSKHFAERYGIVWNIGADPVEGYTSTLWMILGAFAHVLGVEPILFLKTISTLATLAMLGGIYLYGRYSGVNWLVAFAGAGQIAFNPATAVHTAQAMETVVTMFLVFLSSLSAIEYMKTEQLRWLLGMHFFLALGFLTRPGLVAYAGGLLFAILIISVARHRRQEVVKQLLAGGLILFIPGLVYLAVRYSYFGYLFPNAFHVKESAGLISSDGVSKTVSFVKLLLPIAFLAVLSKQLRQRRDGLTTVTPLLVGSSTFLFIWMFFAPLQANLWRYQIPVMPALVLALVLLIRDFKSLLPPVFTTDKYRIAKYAVIITLVISITIFPLSYIGVARTDMDKHPINDRVAGGKALGTVPNPHSHRMLVSESGAVPYYSEWHAVDQWGLNNETIAHHGLNETFVSRYDPHLVMLLVSNTSGMFTIKAPAIAAYLDEHKYEIVAVTTRKGVYTGKTYRHHVYLVGSDAPHKREIACTLLTMNGVTYAPRKPFAQKADIKVSASQLSSEDCPG